MNQAVASRQYQQQNNHHHQKGGHKPNNSKKAASIAGTSSATASAATSRSKRKHQNKLRVRQQLQKKIQKQQQLNLKAIEGGGDGNAVERGQLLGEQQPEQWPSMTVGAGELRTPDAAAGNEGVAAPQQTNQDAMMITGDCNNKSNNSNCPQTLDGNRNGDDECMDVMEQVVASQSAAMEKEEEPLIVPIARKTNAELFVELQEALALEPKFQPMLHLPQTSKVGVEGLVTRVLS